MSHILDRPIWSALTTRHAGLAEGGPLAYRYPPSIVGFAAARDSNVDCLAALAALGSPGDPPMRLIEPEAVALPPGYKAVSSAEIVQMVAARGIELPRDDRIRRLTEADAQQMLDLALLTKPGPFSLRAQALGPFWGIEMDGSLVAMGGERMQQDGYSEVSGICTHPDYRGRGLGRLMSVFVAGFVAARGDQPYLHAYSTNRAAIELYESIGFKVRRTLNVAVIEAA
jgi:predicted GNAT family acetyltransferase